MQPHKVPRCQVACPGVCTYSTWEGIDEGDWIEVGGEKPGLVTLNF